MENPAGFPQPRARFAPLNVSMWKTLRCAPGLPHSDRRSAALFFNINRLEIRMTVPKKTVHVAPDAPLMPLIHPLRATSWRSALPFRHRASGTRRHWTDTAARVAIVVPAKPFGPGGAASSAPLSPTVAAL